MVYQLKFKLLLFILVKVVIRSLWILSFVDNSYPVV